MYYCYFRYALTWFDVHFGHNVFWLASSVQAQRPRGLKDGQIYDFSGPRSVNLHAKYDNSSVQEVK